MLEQLKKIIENMVNKPQLVQVTETPHEQLTVYAVSVAPSDMGFLIGKKGKNINALQVIINAMSKKNKKKALIEIVE